MTTSDSVSVVGTSNRPSVPQSPLNNNLQDFRNSLMNGPEDNHNSIVNSTYHNSNAPLANMRNELIDVETKQEVQSS